MKLSNLLVVLTVIILFMFGMILSTSYAMYTKTNSDYLIDSNNEYVDIVYDDDSSIDIENISSISDDYAFALADATNFSANINSDDIISAVISIELGNINISSNLNNSNFKYELLFNNKVISSGDFSNIVNNNVKLIDDYIIYKGSRNDFKVRIWLSNSNLFNDIGNNYFMADIYVDVIEVNKS